MSKNTLHYARQAVALLEAAEAKGLPVPDSAAACRFEQIDLSLSSRNREEFREWAAFVKAPYVLYEDMAGTSNTYATGEFDGSRVLIYTSRIAPDQSLPVSVVYHLDRSGDARCRDIGKRSTMGVHETDTALIWHRAEDADSEVWQNPETRVCSECAASMAADALAEVAR